MTVLDKVRVKKKSRQIVYLIIVASIISFILYIYETLSIPFDIDTLNIIGEKILLIVAIALMILIANFAYWAFDSEIQLI